MNEFKTTYNPATGKRTTSRPDNAVNGAPTPKLSDVTVELNDDGTVTVWPVWSDVDRSSTSGISVRASDKNLRDRLVRAIRDGAVFTNPTICRDVNNQTYVSTTAQVMGRYIDTDLKKLGY